MRGYALKASALAYSDPTNAIIFALQGQEVDPNFAPLYAALSVANTYIYRYSQALAAGERAIELDPTDANNYRAYSTPLIYVGRSEEAIEALETATQINPNLPGAWFGFGVRVQEPWRKSAPRHRHLSIHGRELADVSGRHG
ncbi:MAG: hypothetical protein HND48_24045 [Chloroflexi bacterium]|nr:hypothetical protein [Chloroflexota bacterium]